jgi:divalent metal cation (Fe/Co/Zn/Cd) transporter
MLRPALDELMDTTPNLALNAEIRKIAEAVSGVDKVETCIVRKMGYHLFVDMHIEVDAQMTVERAHRIAHDVKDKVRGKLPTVYDVLVHIEPSERPPGEGRAGQMTR